MQATGDDGLAFVRAFSRLLGWAYFLCWSASFYPQPLLNWRRKSTHGLAIDFPVCNILGFAAYTASTATFLFSPTIRGQYAYRHPNAPETTVRFNDFVFAAHGAIMCVITYSQFYPSVWGFQVGKRQKASGFAIGVFWGSLVGVFVVLLVVLSRGKDGGNDASAWAWIDLIYAISYIKIMATVIKYCPQVVVNYRRRSTVGWSISQILLDLAGGVMSILQLVIDSSLQADWSGVSGNPVKLLLGNVSILFDIVFCAQHYLLYRNAGLSKPHDDVESEDEAPLINGSSDD